MTRHPNELKLLARSNAALRECLNGACGCAALGVQTTLSADAAQQWGVEESKGEWVKAWEGHGVGQLLTLATWEDRRGEGR